MVLLYMEDMRIVTLDEIGRCLDVKHTIAYAVISAMTKRGWLAYCKGAPNDGWRLTSTGWLLAAAEASDELELKNAR